MGIKILIRIIRPHVIGAVIAIIVFATIELLFHASWFVAGGIVLGAYIIYVSILIVLQKSVLVNYLTASSEEIEETLRFSLTNHPLPLCLVNSEGYIAMTNARFKEIFPKAKILKTKFSDIVGDAVISDIQSEIGAESKVYVDNKSYRVLSGYVNRDISKSAMYYFIDATEYDSLKLKYEEEKPCYCYLQVDNYEDILLASHDDNRSIIAAGIETAVRQFAAANEGSLLRFRESQYQIVFTKKFFEKMEEEKFPILEIARKLRTDADFPTSFSIGLGLSDESPDQAEEFASYALDLARGRGGDQVVVKNGDEVNYYGGRVQIIENRNKGKSRVMAHAIKQLIAEASNVLIMGHKNADMDSFGASIGICRMVSSNGKKAYIVLNECNHSLEEVYKIAVESGNYNFVSGEDVNKLINKKTLLIIDDTHVPSMVDDSSLLNKVSKIIIIDHHRKMETMIEGATLLYMEPNASSASELVAEILQYDESIRRLDKFEAEMLLGGIFIDTNSFSVKTGARTFEAASWLRMNGADTTAVRQFLQNDMEDFRQRASITANAEFSESGIALSRGDGVHDNAQIIAAQAADELLDIKGIKASFVVGATEKETVISARSLGDINVQVIMEKFGGGGHLTMAAAQIENSTIEDVVKTLKKYIREAEGEKE